MTRLRGKRDKLNRAQSIISGIGKNPEDEKPELPPVDGVEPTEPQEPVEPQEPQEPKQHAEPQEPAEPVEPTEPNEPAEPQEPAEPIINEPETPPALSEISDDVILSKLSETLGRKIESYDDLKPKEIEVDPELKQLIEWKEKTGLSLTQFADYNKDFSKMGDMEVAREILSQRYPTFTKEQLDFELNSLVYDEDVDDEADKMRKSIELTKLATEGRQMLESKKLELKPVQFEGLTAEQQEAIEYANNAKTVQAQTVENQKAYESNLKLAAQNLDTITLELDEGVVIDHKVDDGIKKGLKDYILNVPHWFNEDGTPNPANVASDGYKIQNFDKLLKLAYEQGKAVQKEADIKGKGNISLDPQSKPQGEGSEKKGNIQSVVDNLTGSNPNKFRFRKNKS